MREIRATTTGLLWAGLAAGFAGAGICGQGTAGVLFTALILYCVIGLAVRAYRRIRRGDRPAIVWEFRPGAPASLPRVPVPGRPRTALMLAVLAGSLITLGVLPPAPHDQAAGFAVVMVLIVTALALITDSVRQVRQRKWRETGGRMGRAPAQPGPRTPTISDLAGQLAEVRSQADRNSRRLDDYDRAQAIIAEASGEPTPRLGRLRLVRPGDQQS